MSKITVQFEIITPSLVRHIKLVKQPIQCQTWRRGERKENLCKFKKMISRHDGAIILNFVIILLIVNTAIHTYSYNYCTCTCTTIDIPHFIQIDGDQV